MKNGVISGRYRFCLVGEGCGGEELVKLVVKNGKVGGTERCGRGWWSELLSYLKVPLGKKNCHQKILVVYI